MRGGIPVLRPVDGGLAMLDAHAHRKRLLLHERTRLVEHGERVARRMPAGKHHNAVRRCAPALPCARPAPPRRPAARPRNPTQRAAHGTAPRRPRLRSARAGSARRPQARRCRCGASPARGSPRRARVREPTQHMARIRAFDVGGQLAVRERARAAPRRTGCSSAHQADRLHRRPRRRLGVRPRCRRGSIKSGRTPARAK